MTATGKKPKRCKARSWWIHVEPRGRASATVTLDEALVSIRAATERAYYHAHKERIWEQRRRRKAAKNAV